MKQIAVMPNKDKDIGLAYAKRVVNAINGRACVYMENSFSKSGIRAEYCPRDELFENADTVIILGGDGTILHTAHKCAEKNIPILGINLGTVGFMSEVEPSGTEMAVEKLLSDDFTVQSRMMMAVDVYYNNCKTSYHALNDVVVSKNINSKLPHIKVYSEDELVNTYTADGIIVATPTGSTAYSFSAGGPVVDPLMQMFIVTPVCPHMLTARSAVMSAQKIIALTFDLGYESCMSVAVDGDIQENIDACARIVIRKSELVTRLIKIQHRSFYDTLITKLS